MALESSGMPPLACADLSRCEVDHRELSAFNQTRLRPGLPSPTWLGSLIAELEIRKLENEFLENAREEAGEIAHQAPTDPADFLGWFEALRDSGPGQHDGFFRYLAESASWEEMRWFISQEVAGEAGFDDLVALAQLKAPTVAKLEMARNYWDEMGRGISANMHSQLLERVMLALRLDQVQITILREPLVLSNLMMGLACNRAYAYHAIGALGAIELTAPTRVTLVAQGLRRLGLNAEQSRYYDLHGVLDPCHSRAWNREVIMTLIRDQQDVARAIAEGAVMRLQGGARCVARYREHVHLA
jgi:hypothetical protein